MTKSLRSSIFLWENEIFKIAGRMNSSLILRENPKNVSMFFTRELWGEEGARGHRHGFLESFGIRVAGTRKLELERDDWSCRPDGRSRTRTVTSQLGRENNIVKNRSIN